MGFIHNLFWNNHDRLESDLGIMSNNYQESLKKNAAQLLENEGLRDGLEQAQKKILDNMLENEGLREELKQAQKTFLDHTLQCNEAAENAEKLVGAVENTELVGTSTDLAEQALQAAEIAGDSDKALTYTVICAVFITTLVCIAAFTILCAYLGNRIEQNRNEEQNLAPETDMSSSRTSSVSNLTRETEV